MRLLPDHDNAIFTCINTVLEQESQSIGREDDMVQIMQAILSSTQRAFAVFAERWNARSSVHLPPELLAACFNQLSFNNRLTVSHVSQHWRAVALGTPALWARFRTNTRSGGDTGKLSEMLRRSQAVPLSVQLLLTPDEEALLRPHFHRLHEVVCANAPSGSLEAPMLSKLEISRMRDDPFVLSTPTVGSAASSLHTLKLRNFALAPSCPTFLNLREFRADFTKEADTSLSSVLALCPVLESLTVWCGLHIGSDPRLLFVPLPASLRDLTISGILGSLGPDSAIMQRWAGHAFRKLHLSSLYDMSGVIQWFTTSYSPQPWSLTLRRDHIIVLSLRTLTADAAGNVTHRNIEALTEATSPRFHNREAVPEHVSTIIQSQAQFGFLTKCTLSLIFFGPIVTQGIRMPALVVFVLAVHPDEDGDPPHSLVTRADGGSGISAPILRSFAFVCREGYAFRRTALRWFYETLTRELRTWMLYDASRLERLSLEGVVPRRAMNRLPKGVVQDSPVFELADVVYIAEPTGA